MTLLGEIPANRVKDSAEVGSRILRFRCAGELPSPPERFTRPTTNLYNSPRVLTALQNTLSRKWIYHVRVSSLQPPSAESIFCIARHLYTNPKAKYKCGPYTLDARVQPRMRAAKTTHPCTYTGGDEPERRAMIARYLVHDTVSRRDEEESGDQSCRRQSRYLDSSRTRFEANRPQNEASGDSRTRSTHAIELVPVRSSVRQVLGAN